MTVLETRRLILRPWTEDDVPAMHVIFSDPEAMRFWNTPLSRGPEDLVGRPNALVFNWNAGRCGNA